MKNKYVAYNGVSEEKEYFETLEEAKAFIMNPEVFLNECDGDLEINEGIECSYVVKIIGKCVVTPTGFEEDRATVDFMEIKDNNCSQE